MFIAVIAGFGTFLFLRILEGRFGWSLLKKKIFCSLIQSHCVYPMTSTCKEKDSIALFRVNAEDVPSWDSSSSDLSKLINWNDLALAASGVHREAKPIIDIISSNADEFFINQVDFLILSKMGMEVIIVYLGHRGKNRSLFLELTGIRNNVHSYFLAIEIGIAVLSALLANAWNTGSLSAIFAQLVN